MSKYLFPLILFCSLFTSRSFAQDTLPRITVRYINKQVIVSWRNNFGRTINTINIQRSADSIKKFTTIGTVLNPLNRNNGFVDPKPVGKDVFYRVFIVFEGGSYIFTKSYKPFEDTVKPVVQEPTTQAIKVTPPPVASKAPTTGVTPVKPSVPAVPVAPPPPPPPPVWEPSVYIYTGKDNNVSIDLPMAKEIKYSAKFYDSDKKYLFELKRLPETFLSLQKENFKHSGCWFYFELFGNGLLIEENKFFIAKEILKKEH